MERQLFQWSNPFRAGKRLRLDVSFNYVEIRQPASKRGGRREYPSARQQMLAERDLRVDAEEEMSSLPSVWQDVYNLNAMSRLVLQSWASLVAGPARKEAPKLETH